MNATTTICMCTIICTIIIIAILIIIIYILNDIRTFLDKIYNAINYSINKIITQNHNMQFDYLSPFVYDFKNIKGILKTIEKLLSETTDQKSDSKEE